MFWQGRGMRRFVLTTLLLAACGTPDDTAFGDDETTGTGEGSTETGDVPDVMAYDVAADPDVPPDLEPEWVYVKTTEIDVLVEECPAWEATPIELECEPGALAIAGNAMHLGPARVLLSEDEGVLVGEYITTDPFTVWGFVPDADCGMNPMPATVEADVWECVLP